MAKALGAFKEAVSFADENPVLADPAPFVGSASCAGCYSEQFQTQQSSRHARTFHRVSELRDFVPPRPALPDPVDARITHTLRKAGDRLEQRPRRLSVFIKRWSIKRSARATEARRWSGTIHKFADGDRRVQATGE